MHGPMHIKILYLSLKLIFITDFSVNDHEQAKNVKKKKNRKFISPFRLKESPFFVHNTKPSAENVMFNCLLLTYLLTYLRNYLLTNLLTYLLTPRCWVLLENLTGLQLVKKFPAFHGTRRFITALTSVRQLSLSWASPIQSIYPHPTSWWSS